MVLGKWFGSQCFFRSHGLHVMNPLKGLDEIILEVRGECSLGWLGRIWSRGFFFISLLIMVMELRDVDCGILFSKNH
jgi:hypothetical protein